MVRAPRTVPEIRGVAVATALVLLVLGAAAHGFEQSIEEGAEEIAEIPAHPDQLQFGELDFSVPDVDDVRHRLPSGNSVYIVEDHALPLVDISVQVRVGSFLEPADKVGVADLTAGQMRRGGAGERSAEELDERADFLAARIGMSSGTTSAGASVNCLTKVLEECLGLFFDVLQRPLFQATRLAVEKENLLEDLKQRNDRPASIARREWQWLLYGDEHFASRMITGESLAAIQRQDLVEFHRNYWRPEGMIFSVAGDVDTQSILSTLEKYVAAWPAAAGADVPWPPPENHYAPEPGVYFVEKDIPQGRVRIGHRTRKRAGWDDPDGPPALVMNDILGGGGFTARLTSRIRSDEGLAYSAGSQLSLGTYWAGSFAALYQSKSETVAYAAQIALEEIERLRTEPVTDEELATSKASFIETFPSYFESSSAVARLYANDEYLGRSSDYWKQYRERIRAVTAADVQRVAKELLRPEDLVFLIVGSQEQIQAGDPDGRASMEDFFDGQNTLLPARDPVTLQPE